jgi:hypothetical protein
MKKTLLSFSFIICACGFVFAQTINNPVIKPTLHRYFDTNAKSANSADARTAVANGQPVSDFSCSPILTVSGDLLFYTNGMRVWNKNNLFMSNGTGLNGAYNGRVLIIPQDGNTVELDFTP